MNPFLGVDRWGTCLCGPFLTGEVLRDILAARCRNARFGLPESP